MAYEAPGLQCVDKKRRCGNNKAPAFLRGLRFVWCGTRRTVVVGGARFSAGLEFGRKFGVPLLVTINKSASYGAQWNRIGDVCGIHNAIACT